MIIIRSAHLFDIPAIPFLSEQSLYPANEVFRHLHRCHPDPFIRYSLCRQYPEERNRRGREDKRLVRIRRRRRQINPCRVRHHYDGDMGNGGRYAGTQGGISKLKTVVSRKFAIFLEKLEKFPEMW